jgi:hypothetical protein
MSKSLPTVNDSFSPNPFTRTDFLEYYYSHSEKVTFIKIKFNLPFFNTSDLPQTFNFLKNRFPGVLTTECFNQDGLPFNQEVTATELGHLFEHILIRKIYDLKKEAGEENFIVDGRTDWDWKKEEKGIFNIFISSGEENLNYFEQALNETVSLFENLIYSQQTTIGKATDNYI